jgi:hypothetical protein
MRKAAAKHRQSDEWAVQRSYKEDKWYGLDQSMQEKVLKMPNVKAKKEKYSKEIGIKVAERPPEKIEQIQSLLFLPEDNDKLRLKEIKQMLPMTPFYKIVSKDRIEIIDNYTDKCPCLSFRKCFMKLRVYTNRAA